MNRTLSSTVSFALAAAAPLAAQLTWTQLQPPGSPGPRYGHAMVYHEALGRVVLFGGANDTVNKLDDTWEFDGTTWRLMTPATRPPARRWHSMVYNSTLRTVVLYGGDMQSASGAANDVWTYGTTGWANVTPTASPPGRYGHCATYDPGRQVMLVFGGMTTSQPLRECWQLNNQLQWQPVSVPLPPGRTQAGMVYDSHRRVHVLTGGVTGSFHLRDTWEFDGLWRQTTPSGLPVQQISLAYDSVRRRVLFFGGLVDEGSGPQARLVYREYHDGNWFSRLLDPTPGPRTSGRLVFDPQSGSTILFGGSRFPGSLGDTWRLAAQIPATAVPFGSSCGGTAPALAALEPNERPWIGSPFGLRVSGLPGNTLAGIYFGASRTSWAGVPLPLDLAAVGMPGCQQLVSGDVLVGVGTSGGVGDLVLTVPGSSALNGQQLFTQAVVFSPAANPAGFLTTNAQTLTLGQR